MYVVNPKKIKKDSIDAEISISDHLFEKPYKPSGKQPRINGKPLMCKHGSTSGRGKCNSHVFTAIAKNSFQCDSCSSIYYLGAG